MFFVQPLGGGWFTMQAWPNRLLVAAEHNVGGRLRARTSPGAVGPWEKFTLVGLV